MRVFAGVQLGQRFHGLAPARSSEPRRPPIEQLGICRQGLKAGTDDEPAGRSLVEQGSVGAWLVKDMSRYGQDYLLLNIDIIGFLQKVLLEHLDQKLRKSVETADFRNFCRLAGK